MASIVPNENGTEKQLERSNDEPLRGPTKNEVLANDASTAIPALEKIPADDEENHHQIHPPAADQPPDGGFGWIVVLCQFLLNVNTWGVNAAFGVFLSYYLNNAVFPGATYLDYAFVGGLSVSCCLLVSPLATLTTRFYGMKACMTIGLILEMLSLISASFAKQTWELFLSQGVCFGLGIGFIYIGCAGVVAQWFTSKRGIANGLSAAGSGVGGVIYSLAVQKIIDELSLAWAFRILGIVTAVSNAICIIVIKDRHKAVGSTHRMFDLKIVKRREFVLLQCWGFLCLLGFTALLFTFPSYAVSVGLTSPQAAVIGAMFSTGQAIGRPAIGLLSDRLGRLNVAMVVTFLSGLFSFVVWIFCREYGDLIFCALLLGMTSGIFWAMVPVVTAEVVGLKELSSALAACWILMMPAPLVAEPIALEIRTDTPAGYLSVQIYVGAMFLGATICIYGVRMWKIKDMDKGEPIVPLAKDSPRSTSNEKETEHAPPRPSSSSSSTLHGDEYEQISRSKRRKLIQRLTWRRL